MADVHGSPGAAPQMPAASGPGPAPVPYNGQLPGGYAVPAGPMGPDGAVAEVMQFPGQALTLPHPAAYDVAAGVADAPYYAGPLAPIDAAGDNDAGGRDDVAATVGQAVANAEARFTEHQSDTYGQGSVIGDLVTFPPSPLDPGAGVGNTMPAGGFYDPDRDYGGAKGAPGYQGKAQ